MTTWVLVAHRSGARLLENPGPGKGLKLLEDIAHPQGRLKNGEINADKPGRAFDKFGGGRHSMSKEHEPVEQVAIMFAKQLGEKLDQGRIHNQYQRLILVAEPRFLGELRATLTSPTAALVSDTIDKDLIGVENRDLPKHLESVLAV
jgi:protein required for attachment to host cells